MQYTGEQQAAIASYASNGHVKLIAFAGSGKTSTLAGMAYSNPYRRGTYVAFNRSIATEAGQKFPRNVQCRTAHSMAYRAVAQMGYDADRMRSSVNVRVLRDEPIRVSTQIEGASTLLIGALRRFCQSADEHPLPRHVPRPRKPVEPEVWEEQREVLANAVRVLWSRMTDANGSTPIGHDGYLKIWQLSRPCIPTDTLFLDEAQDLNPVLIDVVRNQQCQIVSVGDGWQAIYEWRGAVNALEILPGNECRLTQSFRFGENIAALGNRLLHAMGETVPLRGNGRDDWVGESDSIPDCVICRTNAGVISNILRLIDTGNRVCVPGGGGELLALVEDAERLQGGRAARTMDLLGFRNWGEVLDYVREDERSDLSVLVSLVGAYGCTELLRALRCVQPAESPGSVTVVTAHKSKGLEWSHVEINDDFEVAGDVGLAERRLFYVACTRARQELSVSEELVETYAR